MNTNLFNYLKNVQKVACEMEDIEEITTEVTEELKHTWIQEEMKHQVLKHKTHSE